MLARRVCVFYLFLLGTVILLIGNPLKYVDDPVFAKAYKTIEPGLHVGLFAILGFLVGASRWRVHPMIQIGLLVTLAASSELVQFLLPNRTPRIGCSVQDVVGLVIGAAVWALLVYASNERRRPHNRHSVRRRPPHG